MKFNDDGRKRNALRLSECESEPIECLCVLCDSSSDALLPIPQFGSVYG